MSPPTTEYITKPYTATIRFTAPLTPHPHLARHCAQARNLAKLVRASVPADMRLDVECFGETVYFRVADALAPTRDAISAAKFTREGVFVGTKKLSGATQRLSLAAKAITPPIEAAVMKVQQARLVDLAENYSDKLNALFLGHEPDTIDTSAFDISIGRNREKIQISLEFDPAGVSFDEILEAMIPLSILVNKMVKPIPPES